MAIRGIELEVDRYLPDKDAEYDEDLQKWKNWYVPERKKKVIATQMYSFVRRHFKVSPAKVKKADIDRVLRRYAQMPRSLKNKDYLLARRLAFRADGKPHKTGAWNQGLYDKIRSMHVSKSSKGSEYIRSYRRWTASELAILRHPAYSREFKIGALGQLSDRSEASVIRKMQRLGIK